MTRWYRAYEGTVTDPKLAEAAMVADTSRSVSVASWHLILENAAAVNDGGRIDIPTRRIAAALCEPLSVVEALVEAFRTIGLLTGSHVAAWKRRQYESDSSAERVRRHRQKNKQPAQCNGDETLQAVTVTPPKTETETEGSEANASGTVAPLPLSASDVQRAIFGTGVNVLTASGTPDRQARSLIGRWRKEYSDSAVLTVLSRCQVEQPEVPIEWITKTLQAEQRRASGVAHDQRPQPAKPSLIDTARSVAERLEAEHRAYAGH